MRLIKSAIAIIVVALTVMGAAFAQTQQATPSHVHYSEPAQQSQPSPTGALAPRLQNLGNHRFPVTTKNRQAQLFINQGVNLAYAFNPAEAARAFRKPTPPRPLLAM